MFTKNTTKLDQFLNHRKIIITLFALIGFVTASQSQNLIKKQDLSFDNFLSKVGQNNLSYIAEKYNVSIADAEVVAQKVLPDPSLEFEAENEQFSLGLGYTVELGNKRGARVRLAKSQAELERLALEYYFQDLRSEAANAYLDAMLQKELLETKKSSYHYMLELSKSDSIRFKLGEISEIDARQSKLEAASLLNEVYEQEAAYNSALATLNQLMGSVSDTLSIPSGKWIDLDKDFVLSELTALGLTNRVDLLAAHKSIEVATNQHKLVKAERNMDIDLGVSYERDWRGFLPPSRSVKGSVSIPLKFSNLNKGAIKAAQFSIEQSKVQEKQLELQIQTEISQAFFQYEAAKKKVKQYQLGLLDESRKILDGMVYKYNRGETNILEVLVAQRTYNDMQEQYIETMKEYASSLVELQKNCGIWNLKI